MFLLVATLVIGGLGWVTADALRLEQEQQQARADAEFTQKLHVALWRLDGRVAPALARGRQPALQPLQRGLRAHRGAAHDGTAWPHGSVIEPSPLLQADLPEWMLLHFQADEESGWESPQVPYGVLRRRLINARTHVPLCNVDTDERRQLLGELEKAIPAGTLLATIKERGAAPTVNDITLVPVANAWDNNGTLNNPDGATAAGPAGHELRRMRACNGQNPAGFRAASPRSAGQQ